MKTRSEIIRKLVNDCIISHNEEVIIQLILKLELEYKEIAELSTFGEYTSTWTHQQVLRYITEET
ncbi:hypothetical protein EB118_00745 [bacterium]|nr:hypothetical protein [bacterium]